MTDTRPEEVETVLTLLRRLSPREQLHVIAQVLAKAERDLNPPATSKTAESKFDEQSAEAQFLQTLLVKGLITQVKVPGQCMANQPRTPPTEVEGRPLSEMIIAERR